MTNSLVTVEFQGSAISALRGDTPETTMVPMKAFVEGMGLAWQPQQKKIQDHPVLTEGITISMIPSPSGAQQTLCLSLAMLPLWLVTIQTNKLRDQGIRERITAYQREAAKVLSEACFGSGELRPAGEMTQLVAAQVRQFMIDTMPALIDRMVEDRLLADPRFVATDHKPALQVLIEHHVPSKGRRAFTIAAIRQLMSYSTWHNHPIRRSRETGRYLFSPEAISGWLASGGRAWIAERVATMRGQGVLPFKVISNPAPEQID